MDNPDLPVERLTVGGWTKREDGAFRMLETIVGNSPTPEPINLREGESPADGRARQREALDRWVDNRAELSVQLADTLFDYLDAARSLTPAQLRETTANIEAMYREDIEAWKTRAEEAEEALRQLERGNAHPAHEPGEGA